MIVIWLAVTAAGDTNAKELFVVGLFLSVARKEMSFAAFCSRNNNFMGHSGLKERFLFDIIFTEFIWKMATFVGRIIGKEKAALAITFLLYCSSVTDSLPLLVQRRMEEKEKWRKGQMQISDAPH